MEEEIKKMSPERTNQGWWWQIIFKSFMKFYLKMQDQLKTQVQTAVKRAMIDTKYQNEPISFGQAVVTHHFLNEIQVRGPRPNSPEKEVLS